MISPPNLVEVPTTPYENIFCPPTTHSMEGSVATIGVIYHGYRGPLVMAQNYHI
jgi:hypothetical protein